MGVLNWMKICIGDEMVEVQVRYLVGGGNLSPLS
jgi:hypothetical protein